MTHVLIVDDKEENRYFLRVLLQGQDFEVAEARHGVEALEWARRNPPHLIISDLLMPVMDGYTLLSQWKADERLRAIPFVVFTATYTEPQDERLALDLGADAFIVKPAEPESFLARLRAILASKVSARHAAQAPKAEESVVLREYNEVLVRKLEQKTLALEAANKAMRHSEEKFSRAFRSTPDSVTITTLRDGRYIDVNDGFTRLTGFSREEVIGRTARDLNVWVDPADRDRMISLLDRDGSFRDFEFAFRTKAGEIRTGVRSAERMELNGEPCMIGITRDITERKHAERQLQESEKRFSSAFQAGPLTLSITTLDGKFVEVNQAYCDLLEYSPDEVKGKSVTELGILSPQQREKLIADVERAGGSLTNSEVKLRSRTGRLVDFLYSVGPISIGGVPHRLSTGVDITARKQAEAEHRRAEEQLRLHAAALEAAANAIVITDSEGQIIWVNPAFTWLTGYTLEEVRGENPRLLKSGVHPPAFYEELWTTVLAGRVWHGEITNQRKDGSLYYEEQTITPLLDATGKISHFIAVKQDVTERNRVAEALRASEARHRDLIANAVYGIWLTTLDGKILYANSAMASMLGYGSLEELQLLRLPEDVYQNPKDRSVLVETTLRLGAITGFETLWKRKDQKQITVRLGGRVVRNIYGQPESFEIIAEDITERRNLEVQLRQAQKMEAVGQLAGGVAHDFNNLLGVILGYGELILEKSPGDEPVQEICAAAKRGATLTRQLLAFSRQQVLTLRPLNLNHVIRDAQKLLTRLLREDIAFQFHPASDLWTVKADPTQVEQILMNLVANARDAMPLGGTLMIETVNVELTDEYVARKPVVTKGPYVCITVSDTGMGMDAETQARIFEPFFTTKEKGKGTGMGLATVYGIVRQLDGHIWVYSEVNHGTTFKAYLPAVREAVETRATFAQEQLILAGNATILLVEDVQALRKLTRTILETYGYTVLEAADGVEALQLAEDHPGAIHLLLTDVVMPKMSGKELARALGRKRKEVKLLFMTGYSQEVIKQRTLGADSEVLQKPFTPGELLARVRKVLDTAPTRKQGRKK